MKCSKRLTPVSYNTEDWLRTHCEDRVKDGTFCHYVYIRHEGEYDYETGRKDKEHRHCLFILAKPCDNVEALLETFNEPDQSNVLPLKTRIDEDILNRKARNEMVALANWLLYNLHDEQYLFAQGLVREKHYKYSDLVTDSPEWLKALWDHLSRKWGEFEDLRRPPLAAVTEQCLLGELTPQEALRRNWIPPVQYRSLMAAVQDSRMDVIGHLREMTIENTRKARNAEKRAIEAERKAQAQEMLLGQFSIDDQPAAQDAIALALDSIAQGGEKSNGKN